MQKEIEMLAKKANMEVLSMNPNDRKTLAEVYNKIQDSSSKLLSIDDYDNVGTAYFHMLALEMSNDDKINYVMTINSFYCFTKGIEKTPTDFTLKRKRLMLYEDYRKQFNDLIICALDIDLNPMNRIGSIPVWMEVRDAIYKMEIVDFFDPDKRLQEDWACKHRKPEYEKMIKEDFFHNETIDTLKAEGRHNIMKCVKWLESCYSEY